MNEQFHSQRTVVRSEDFSILAKSSCNFKLEIQKSIFFKSVSGILPTKTTAKLTLNVGRHGCLKSLKQQFFTCLSDWKTSELHLVPRNFYNKRIVVKNCKNSFENNQIMRNSAYLQKRIISASIKILQIKLLSSRLMFNNLTKLTKILLSSRKKINIKGCVFSKTRAVLLSVRLGQYYDFF